MQARMRTWLKLIADNPGTIDDDARAAVYRHLMF
jgi:hypothetical protein